MATTPYIQVIVPLRLEWEPFYCLEGAAVGERVKVRFANREYVGVVSEVNVVPETVPEHIQPAFKTDLPPVHPREIVFWRAIAGYYLCSVGEVYKAAYPVLRQESDAVKVRADERFQKRLALLREKLTKARKEQTRERYAGEIGRLEAFLRGEDPVLMMAGIPLSPAQETAVEAVRKGFSAGKTVLLRNPGGSGKMEIYLEMARQTLAQGKSVLYLVPEIGLSRQLEERIAQFFPGVLVYHSARSAAQKRAVADAIRDGRPKLVLGTRSALFLPHRNLGLVMLDQEHETSYKQDSPAPRYHARESAILLAGIHRANVLLGSATPSLESLYNAETGRFAKVELKEDVSTGIPGIQLIDIMAEARKKGMVGNLSLKLLEQLHRALDAGEKVLVVCRSKAAVPECSEELEAIFGPGLQGMVLATPATAKEQPAGAFGVTAVLQADCLLAREDFRCDERAHQILSLLQEKCLPQGVLVIQTREASHPVFGPYGPDRVRQLLEERRQFGYPPYTRLIHIVVRDQNLKRGAFMLRELAAALAPFSPLPGMGMLRVTLPRDKTLLERKQALQVCVAHFEKERRYPGHICLDVDPV